MPGGRRSEGERRRPKAGRRSRRSEVDGRRSNVGGWRAKVEGRRSEAAVLGLPGCLLAGSGGAGLNTSLGGKLD